MVTDEADVEDTINEGLALIKGVDIADNAS